MALFTSKPSMPSQLANAIPTTGAMPAAPMRTPVPAPSAALTQDDLRRARQLTDRIRARFAQTLVGQSDLREALIATMVAGGHILIESVPGLAKTTAAQTLATSVSGTFRRVQCTPDLMPSDLVGTQVFDFSTQRFSTQIGPIHANFVLLDEINRSNAKTQSAMLEAMSEGATTIGGERIELPKPFMVIATENPIEEEGTFNLPEAQMDRFMMKAVMTYPKADEETSMLAMLTAPRHRHVRSEIAAVRHDHHSGCGVSAQIGAGAVHVSEAFMRYAVDLVATSRGAGNKPLKGLSSTVRLGASPRASIALIRSGQANALLAGPGLRHPRGCEDDGPRSAQAPCDPDLRGAGRRRDQRSGDRSDRGNGSRPMIDDSRPSHSSSSRRPRIRRKIEALGNSLSLPTVRKALGVLEGEHASNRRGGNDDPMDIRVYGRGTRRVSSIGKPRPSRPPDGRGSMRARRPARYGCCAMSARR